MSSLVPLAAIAVQLGRAGKWWRSIFHLIILTNIRGKGDKTQTTFFKTENLGVRGYSICVHLELMPFNTRGFYNTIKSYILYTINNIRTPQWSRTPTG